VSATRSGCRRAIRLTFTASEQRQALGSSRGDRPRAIRGRGRIRSRKRLDGDPRDLGGERCLQSVAETSRSWSPPGASSCVRILRI
jgi:hypothetical protein